MFIFYMLKKGPLSEQEKIQILTSAAYLHSLKHKLIGEMMNRSPYTVKNFFNHYQSTKQLSPKRGRPPIINEMIEEGDIAVNSIKLNIMICLKLFLRTKVPLGFSKKVVEFGANVEFIMMMNFTPKIPIHPP